MKVGKEASRPSYSPATGYAFVAGVLITPPRTLSCFYPAGLRGMINHMSDHTAETEPSGGARAQPHRFPDTVSAYGRGGDTLHSASAGPVVARPPGVPPGPQGLANAAPLGLSAFAGSTFLLSLVNIKVLPSASIVLGMAWFMGGLAQLIAGVVEFASGNTFGAW